MLAFGFAWRLEEVDDSLDKVAKVQDRRYIQRQACRMLDALFFPIFACGYASTTVDTRTEPVALRELCQYK